MTLDQVPFALVFDRGRKAIAWDCRNGWQILRVDPGVPNTLPDLFATALKMALATTPEGIDAVGN